MTFQQNSVKRDCAICVKPILPGFWMLDLFRQASAKEAATERVEWVHESCARAAIEAWLKKKREKAAK